MDTLNGNSNGNASLLEEKDIPTDDSYESVEHEHESVADDYIAVDPESADLEGLEAAYAFDDDAFQSAPDEFVELAQTPEEKSAADSEAALLQYSGYAAPPEELAAMGASPPEPASASAESVEGEDDEDESLDLDPRRNKTKVGLINSPLSKAAFVGGGGLIAVVAAGMLMGQFGGSKKAQVVEEAAKDPTAIASPGVANEVGTYKTGMALTTQRNLLANAKPQPGQVKPVRRNAVDAKMNTPEQSVPTAAALLPAPATMMSTPLEPLPTAFRSVGSLEPIKPPTVEEAIAKWQALAGLGSYGAVQRGTQSQSFNSNMATGFSNESLGANGMTLSPRAQQASLSSASTAFPPASTTTSTSSRSITQLRASSSVPGMRDTPLATVLTGTSASGRINNSVIVAADNAQSIDPTSPLSPKYLMELTDSIKDGNGAIAIPTRSQLVLAVKTFSPQSGLGELQVVAVIANGKEYQVPTGAMVVRSPAGSLLAFSNRDKGAGFFSSIIPSVLAGISQAGQAINQPQSSTSVSNGGITTNVNSAKPNALAAFAQGAGQNLSQRVQQNAQTAQQQSSSAPKTWELKAGSAVTVYVNSSFEI